MSGTNNQKAQLHKDNYLSNLNLENSKKITKNEKVNGDLYWDSNISEYEIDLMEKS